MRLEALRKQLVKKTREQVQEHFEGPESHIVQAVNTLQDLDSVYNLMLEHIRTWYGIHFPELERNVKNHETYLNYVIDYGVRDKFT